MKKIILSLSVLFALSFVACNSGTSTEGEATADTTKQVEDVLKEEVVVEDTTATDSTAIDSVVAK